MPRRVVLASAAALAAGLATAVAVAAPSPSGFAYGVAAGEMTPTSARLWTRAPKAGSVTLVVTGAGTTHRFALTASRASDLTVQRTTSGLRPGTAYRYRFAQGSVTGVTGRFETAPAPTSTGKVRFAISGDADATPGPDGKPATTASRRTGRWRGPGTTSTSTSATRSTRTPRSAARRWRGPAAEVGEVPARPRARAAPAPAGLHRCLQRLGRPRVRQRLLPRRARRRDLPRGREGVPRLHPCVVQREHRRLPELPLGQEPRAVPARRSQLPQREGDGRLRRRHRADRAGRGAPGVRRARLRRSRSRCRSRASTRSPSPQRTLLGAAQLAAFTKAIRASTATFKVVVNPEPMLQLYALPYDRGRATRPSARACSTSCGACGTSSS